MWKWESATAYVQGRFVPVGSYNSTSTALNAGLALARRAPRHAPGAPLPLTTVHVPEGVPGRAIVDITAQDILSITASKIKVIDLCCRPLPVSLNVPGQGMASSALRARTACAW